MLEGEVEVPQAGSSHRSELVGALHGARTIDDVARTVLAGLLDLPGAQRVGIAIAEGGGRRLRFLPRDRASRPGELEWCHIDAYDDVPLTRVARTGQPVLMGIDEVLRAFDDFGERLRGLGTEAVAALPLPDGRTGMGGIVVFFDTPQSFDVDQLAQLEGVATGAAEAVRRVRAIRRTVPAARAGEPSRPDDGLRVGTELPDDVQAASIARRFLRGALTAWGLEEKVYDAQLCLSELVTNAVIHASAESELTVSLRDGLLIVHVRDHGDPEAAAVFRKARDLARRGDPMRVYGRGLLLVDAVASRWGADSHATGTDVWFALDVATAPVS